MEHPQNKKIVIVGATSGIGRELALLYLAHGNTVGVTGRRAAELQTIKERYPEQACCKTMDVQTEQCVGELEELLSEMGGMDIMVYCAGVGTQNPALDPAVEMNAVHTNVVGFSRIVIYSYNYFKEKGAGQIVDISSLAGIRSLRQSPAYSATKRYQIHYMSCLAQKAHKEKVRIHFTTIIPGFIRTGMLRYKYPLTISLERGAKLIFQAINLRLRYTTVPGRWRWIEMIWRLIPNAIWERVW